MIQRHRTVHPDGSVSEGTYENGLICDIMHMEQAKALAVYEKDFYAGTPVISENEFGKGKAYYIATSPETAFYDDFLQKVLDDNEIKPVFKSYPDVEVTVREKENNVMESVRSMFGAKTKDFITAVDENNVVVVKELQDAEGNKEIEKAAKALENYLQKEGVKNVHIAYGTVVHEIKEVSRSYKEAKMALDVGKIFYAEKDIVAYSTLGIGRLIYQLPIKLCELFSIDGFAIIGNRCFGFFILFFHCVK